MRGWLLGLGVIVACGEPITPPKKLSAKEGTLPVVPAGPRVDRVGEAYRVVMRIEHGDGVGSTEYTDVVKEVEGGRATRIQRHWKSGKQTEVKPGDASTGFEQFDALLPRREGEVPEAWEANGVLAGWRHSTALPGIPEDGLHADCSIESVVVREKRARAIIAVELSAETKAGALRLAGKADFDMTERLLVAVNLTGQIGETRVAIHATRVLTGFIPDAEK
ncbi:MAG: hypothetical protein ACYTGZ_22495 [Planctomycetota bacterium]|jgi:hypothetical protein